MKFNKGHILEAGDRLHTMIILSEQLLRNHPALKKAKLNKRFKKVIKKLNNMYQKVWQLK